jgi:hypothetical protein
MTASNKHQVEVQVDGAWRALDKYVSREEAVELKRRRVSHGEIARVVPMSKDDPSYLLCLAEEEAGKVADEIVRTNPSEAARGEVMTPTQYIFLLGQRVNHLRKTGKLPRAITRERFDAFEGPFSEVLRRRGLL